MHRASNSPNTNTFWEEITLKKQNQEDVKCAKDKAQPVILLGYVSVYAQTNKTVNRPMQV